MAIFNIITIFPNIFESYFSESIIRRAQDEGKIKINVYNLRDWAEGKHKTVDDAPYGGGAGMILKVEPIYKAVEYIKNVQNIESGEAARVILFSAKGRKYTQSDAERLSRYDNLILICGRYEGVDERVAKHIADEEISIGDYVLTGGEAPSMVLIDSITRLLPGVLGNPRSLEEESFNKIQNPKSKIQNPFTEYSQYTRPESFKGWKVPKVLLSGNHKEIEKWRRKQWQAESGQ